MLAHSRPQVRALSRLVVLVEAGTVLAPGPPLLDHPVDDRLGGVFVPRAAGGLYGRPRLLANLLRQGQCEFVEELQGTCRIPGLEGRLLDAGGFDSFTDGGDRLGDEGPMTREVKNPRESVTTIGVFLICWTKSKVRASVSSEVFSPRMISTSGILSAGEKKWTPMKSAWRSTPVASSVIGRVEVFEPSTASASTTPGSRRRPAALRARTRRRLRRRSRRRRSPRPRRSVDAGEHGLGLLLSGLTLGQGGFLALASVVLALLRGGEFDVLEDDLDAARAAV